MVRTNPQVFIPSGVPATEKRSYKKRKMKLKIWGVFMWKWTGSEPPSKKDALKKATKRIKASLRRHRQKKCSKIHIYIHTLFVYQYTKIAYAMCDLNQNMKQKKQKKNQKKKIAKHTLGNGHTVGFKSFMMLHHCNFCVYQHFHELFSFRHFLIYIR